MRGNRVWLSLLVLIGLLLAPTLASSAPFRAEQLLTATDLVDTSQLSRWVVSKQGAEHLYCEADLTAIAGGGAVILELIACKPDEIVDDGCVNLTDGNPWAIATSMTTARIERMVVLPTVPVGDAGSMSDAEFVIPLPPIWAVHMNETGATTLSYTVDCVWW